MNPSELRTAARRLDRARSVLSDRQNSEEGNLFVCWEWRARHRIDARGAVQIDQDGGLRIERVDRQTGSIEAWRFLVGAEPEDLHLLANGSSDPASGSAEMAQAVVAGLEPALEPAASRPGESSWVRARAWSWGSGEVQTSWEKGRRRAPAACPPTPSRLPREILTGGEYQGPVILRPRAAAWLIHEMGHAAMEAPGSRACAGGGGARIVEDPGSGSWPSGFATDDLGHPARRSVLWDEQGIHPPTRAGHFRRASIRDRAVPSLALTRLDDQEVDRGSISDYPEHTPTIGTITAGRFDPLCGLIWLEIAAPKQQGNNGRGSLVLEVDAEQAWRGLSVMGDTEGHILDPAVCTRQGFMHAVMVGAPTIVLDSVRLSTRDPLPARSSRR